ncbi:hypothetical protein BC827DRAFT_857290 [Russula dissimulans]|nr:hypothetical protein BC827DRAFT_857290 [Russula dissimulans]
MCNPVSCINTTSLTMNPMDAQRYDLDLSKRHSPASEENKADDACGARVANQPVVQDASSIEDPRIPLLTARVALKCLTPIHIQKTQKCDALAVPLPLSPLLSPSRNDFCEDTFPTSDTLHKGSFIKFPSSSEHDLWSRQLPERHLPSLMGPSHKAATHNFEPPKRPLFYRNESPERIFSRRDSPPPVSPPLSSQWPTNPRLWRSACPSPSGWPDRPLSPHSYPFDSSASDGWGSLSCPTSPVLRPSNPLPSPTSPSPCHRPLQTTMSTMRRLRVLSSESGVIRRMSPFPSRPISPLSRPTSPVMRALYPDNWNSERDPTDGIDVIEIFVTTETSVIEETT